MGQSDGVSIETDASAASATRSIGEECEFPESTAGQPLIGVPPPPVISLKHYKQTPPRWKPT